MGSLISLLTVRYGAMTFVMKSDEDEYLGCWECLSLALPGSLGWHNLVIPSPLCSNGDGSKVIHKTYTSVNICTWKLRSNSRTITAIACWFTVFRNKSQKNRLRYFSDKTCFGVDSACMGLCFVDLKKLFVVPPPTAFCYIFHYSC